MTEQPEFGRVGRRRHRLRRAPRTASASSASGRTATRRRRWTSTASGTTAWSSRSTCSSSGSRRARCRPRTRRRPSSRSSAPWSEAQAVGDLDALDARLDALEPLIAAAPRGAQGRARREGGRGQAAQGDDRRGGRDAGARQRLAQRRQPAARAARQLEGAPPDRQGHRRRAVAPVLVRPDDVHPAPQAALRRAQREARGRPGRSRRSWSSRPRRSPTRPTGARPRAPTAT